MTVGVRSCNVEFSGLALVDALFFNAELMTSLPETHNSSCAADFVAQGFAIRRVEFHHCTPTHVFSVFNFRFSVLALCSE